MFSHTAVVVVYCCQYSASGPRREPPAFLAIASFTVSPGAFATNTMAKEAAQLRTYLLFSF
ncbi:hypothetical protein HF324_28485 [Chitinophaga oryzae]|uniref:Uncharacterized protein n=1 Tax=Chitinophaga oryzae TaxID=2725414 RepID=A0AAE6ZLS6_9BACT|nr:hypothetical protein [Chitinophaga oryzae]QJB35054.1 hypothetical protein HF329_28610 [Chitinophaga oryzae]QJB41571.1 hypothetical protein HF324_28485 [Chitinophaga oryzae]